MSTSICILVTTCSPDRAEGLLESLLSERLVACGNLVSGVLSRYWWEGEICREEEVILWMETRAELASQAAERLHKLHPYDVPKILTLDPSDCNADYVDWLRGAIGATAS